MQPEKSESFESSIKVHFIHRKYTKKPTKNRQKLGTISEDKRASKTRILESFINRNSPNLIFKSTGFSSFFT